MPMAHDVSISLVSRKKLDHMSSLEKVAFILDEVKQDKILVLEVGLDPKEEASLIERTMREIEPDHFIGIEMESYKDDSPQRILGLLRTRGKGPLIQGRRASMTVVGPADRLRTISKDGNTIQALILGNAHEPDQARDRARPPRRR